MYLGLEFKGVVWVGNKDLESLRFFFGRFLWIFGICLWFWCGEIELCIFVLVIKSCFVFCFVCVIYVMFECL